jgi:cell division transport system ATP-binding protein
MIQLTGVSKIFGGGNGRPVLDNISFRVHRGEFLYLVGDSGAGKTTLLRMISGDEIPTRGSIHVMGHDLKKVTGAQMSALRQKSGIIFQDLRLIDDLSVEDNVAFSKTLSTQAGRPNSLSAAWKQEVRKHCELVGLTGLLRTAVSKLSGGERQRVAAACALARNPELLIADEPTGSLDRDHAWTLMDCFQKLNMRGTTVILATHDREIMRRVRRRSLVLKNGKLQVEDGLCMF